MKKNITLRLLEKIALVVVLAGASGSLGFTLHAGRNNPSLLLRVLFAGWVLSPFIALLLANITAKWWPVLMRTTLCSLILLLTLGCLVSYSGVLSAPGTKPAFVFLVVPMICWLLIVITFIMTASLGRKQASKNNSEH